LALQFGFLLQLLPLPLPRLSAVATVLLLSRCAKKSKSP
jgi:hypothetical protein